MGSGGSAPGRLALPAPLAPAAVLLGVVAMYAALVFSGSLGTRIALIVSEAFLAAPVLGLMVLFGIPLRAGLSLRPVGRRLEALSLLAGGSLWALSLGLFELQYAVWRPPPAYFEAFRRLHEALRPRDFLDALVSVSAIAVIPAFCEEVLFRGAVLPALMGALGRAGALLASACLFGLIHLDLSAASLPALYRVPFAFVVGGALGLMRLRTGSLLPPVIAHGTLNAITFLVAPLADDPGPGLPDARPLLGACLLLAGSGATWAIFARLARVDSIRARQ